ncbi:hypothetical protein [Enterobacter sp.]|uniref:hypothetical protein n=1 Tax=Enterobacter sp. TaxID=42895 RepID=UPI00296FB7E5|nr:hypothetical protein [Enterobacter sp.]
MELTTETRSILKQYRALINERRRQYDLPPITTAKLIDSMCEYMTCQYSVYLAGQFILQGGNGVPAE